jgi:hypothetical protein
MTNFYNVNASLRKSRISSMNILNALFLTERGGKDMKAFYKGK